MAKESITFGDSRYSKSYANSLAKKYQHFWINPNYSRYYGVKFLELLSKPFTEWEAYKKGFINEHGNKINMPTGENLEHYNYFIILVARLKQLLEKQIDNARAKLIFDRLFLVRESKDDIQKTLDFLFETLDNISCKEIHEIIKETFSGDMATSGAGFADYKIIKNNASINNQKKANKKKKKMSSFKQFLKKDKYMKFKEALKEFVTRSDIRNIRQQIRDTYTPQEKIIILKDVIKKDQKELIGIIVNSLLDDGLSEKQIELMIANIKKNKNDIKI